MTIPPTRDTLPQWGQLAVEAIRQQLHDNLCGLYLFGSAVHGGLLRSSDVDLLAIVTTPQSGDVFRNLTRRLLAISWWDSTSGTGQPVELTVLALPDLVPWRYPPRKRFQFGEWLRPELEREEYAAPSADPDVAIMLAAARNRSVALEGPPLAHLIDPPPEADVRRAMLDVAPEVAQGVAGDERNVILTLARIWMGIESGDLLSKGEAAAQILDRVDPIHRPTLDLARRGYLGEANDNWGARHEAARSFVKYAEREIALAARTGSRAGVAGRESRA